MAKFISKTETDEAAILATSGGEGVHAESSHLHMAAIAAFQTNTDPASTGPGIHGESRGVGAGTVGVNDVRSGPSPAGPGGPGGPGGYFRSEQKEAVYATTKSAVTAAVAGILNNPNGTGAAIYGEHVASGLAGYFKGNVVVTGEISFPGADFAEDFTVEAGSVADPGTVMILSGTGALVPSERPYEKKVVGVVAGGGSFHSGIVMDKQADSDLQRQPIALVGKVFCKVDAAYGSIDVGDLLTSSPTRGHAMRAGDPAMAFGTVIGKAMAPLDEGVGMIPILISLQ